ncbi:hypothetical protein J6590_052388 [Homalodisca vitripennis]|nr:hypothetical protein J6590_052388 [Homalodisca vitripennis]
MNRKREVAQFLRAGGRVSITTRRISRTDTWNLETSCLNLTNHQIPLISEFKALTLGAWGRAEGELLL